jgi:D-alanyl-D-alanine carboxypeptidase
MVSRSAKRRRIISATLLCLIILLSAVIINKFIVAPSGDIIDVPEGPSDAVETPMPPNVSSSGNGEAKTLADLQLDPQYLILVNKEHELPSDYEPKDLTRIKAFAPGRDDSARYMRKEAANQLNAMLAEVKAQGYEVVITTAYRAYWLQKAIFDSNVAKKGSVEAANKTSAKPGQSEHQTGLATDLTTPGLDYQISDNFGETKGGIWITEHAKDYGFILRYPKGREDVTGYTYEPWHIRYVGIDAALYIDKNNLTLEEFLIDYNKGE